MQPYQPLQVTHSLIAANSVSDLVTTAYDLVPPITCRLLSANANDHYLITSATNKYIFRIYHRDKYWLSSTAHYRFELDWLSYLHQQQLPVSYPLPQRDGDVLGVLAAPEGTRYYALFSFAPGTIRYPLTSEQSRILGMQIAQIHQASNDFTSGHPRHHFDLAFLLDDPIRRIRAFLHDSSPAHMQVIERAAEEVRTQFTELTPTHDTYGVIGGDFHGYNNHFTDDNTVTLFDFELCGYGWRAYDLAVFLWNVRGGNAPLELWNALVQEYQTIRPLTEAELAAIPAFVYARHIWLMGVHTTVRERFGEAWLGDDYWNSRIHTLNMWLAADGAG